MFKQIEGMARQRGANQELIPQPYLANRVWATYLRGQTKRRPVNALAVYGTHPDYRWKWVPDVDDPQHRGSWQRMAAGKRPMPVYGPVNWNTLWPDWQSMGDDFIEKGTATHPLSPAQRTALKKSTSDYRITLFAKQLNIGSFGSVWRVSCQERQLHGLPGGIPGREFSAACKVIRLKKAWKDDHDDFVVCVNQMLDDMHALRYIKHKNLVKYYDTISIPDTKTKFPYSTVLVLMELCDGDLDQVIELWGLPLPLDFCRKWMRDIALGVQYLHTDRNMAHLDIKPGNIMFQFSYHDSYRPSRSLANITSQWQTITFKLGDLGTCQSFAEPSAITTEYGGTRLWCSPEMQDLRTSTRQSVSAKPCDVYSLGVSLTTCLLSVLFVLKLVTKGKLFGYMNKIKNGTVVKQGIARQVAQLISSMIDPTPEKRPTIDQVLQEDLLKPFATRDEKRKRDFISMRDIEERQRPKKRMKGYSTQ